MIKVLFVCLGNICRSPLAEAIFLSEIEKRNLSDRFSVDSAGTAAYHVGEAADPRSRQNASENGIAITSRARQFQSHDLQEFDYILAMDHSNFHHISSMAQRYGLEHEHVYLMREFQDADNAQEVPDPYYGGPQGFQNVFEILLDANRKFLNHLIQTHQL